MLNLTVSRILIVCPSFLRKTDFWTISQKNSGYFECLLTYEFNFTDKITIEELCTVLYSNFDTNKNVGLSIILDNQHCY